MNIESKHDLDPDRSRGKPPRNYFSRREQYRLLALVFTFMLVIVLMTEAAKPKNWHWMWRGDPRFAEAPALVDKEIDTKLPRQAGADDPHDLGVLIAQADPVDEPANNEPVENPRGEFFPGVDLDHLKSVRDDTVFRLSEKDAWFHLLEILNQNELPELKKASLGNIGFVQLFEQPKFYRAKIVNVRGQVWRSHRVLAPKNNYGIEGYYICWLQPVGVSPIVVYSLDMPEQFPTGMDIREYVEFTGFFYKRWAYQATDGSRTAPLLLAKIGDWQPAERQEMAEPPSGWLFACVAGGIALVAVMLSFCIYAVSRKSTPANEYSPQSRTSAQEMSALNDVEITTTEEKLRRMADEDGV